MTTTRWQPNPQGASRRQERCPLPPGGGASCFSSHRPWAARWPHPRCASLSSGIPFPKLREAPGGGTIRNTAEETLSTDLGGAGGGGVGESGVCSEPGGGPGPSFSVFLAWVTYSLPFEEEQVATAGICDWDGTLFQGCGKQLL